MLIDLEKPAQAVRLLAPLHDAHRDDETISAALLLAKVRMNARREALDFIAQLEKQPLKDAGVWLKLAKRLYEEQAFPEALALYRQLLRLQPERRAIALDLARTYLRLYEVEEPAKCWWSAAPV